VHAIQPPSAVCTHAHTQQLRLDERLVLVLHHEAVGVQRRLPAVDAHADDPAVALGGGVDGSGRVVEGGVDLDDLAVDGGEDVAGGLDALDGADGLAGGGGHCERRQLDVDDVAER